MPNCQVKRQKENGRKCKNKDFFIILKLDLNALECHFFVCDPWTTELHEMNEKCF